MRVCNDNITMYICRSSTRTVKQYNTRLHIIIIIIIIVLLLYADPYVIGGGPSAENDTSGKKKNWQVAVKGSAFNNYSAV